MTSFPLRLPLPPADLQGHVPKNFNKFLSKSLLYIEVITQLRHAPLPRRMSSRPLRPVSRVGYRTVGSCEDFGTYLFWRLAFGIQVLATSTC